MRKFARILLGHFCSALLLGTLFVLFGCAQRQEEIILDLPKQDLKPFIKDYRTLDDAQIESLRQEYLERFFSPFKQEPKQSASDLQRAFQSAYQNLGFGENLQPYTKEEIEALEFEADLAHYPSVKRVAIVTKNSNLRTLPTNKPRFYNPKLAGEGFPFDYWQNSSVYLGTPILITHYSHSKEWAYVESGFVSGWISVLDIGILDPKQARHLQGWQDFLVVQNDKTPMYSLQGEYLESARIGMILPLKKRAKTHYEAEIYLRDVHGYAQVSTINLDQKDFSEFPMRFSSASVAHLIQGILGEKYGWGGIFENRDCSMFLHDVFGNFGFYLPRNSQAQINDKKAKENLYVEIGEKNVGEKMNFIRENGIPFATFLGMRGHIMLYIGAMNDVIYVVHDIWGLRTLQKETQEGRKIIGKIVITPVDVGKNIHGIAQDTLLIKRIYGMRNLFLKEDLDERN